MCASRECVRVFTLQGQYRADASGTSAKVRVRDIEFDAQTKGCEKTRGLI
jgi:hypothetical protein